MNDRDYVSFYDEKGRFKGLFAWIFSTDHKRIGLLYLYSIMVFFVIGIILGLLMKLELIAPGRTLYEAQTYNSLFTVHGVIMIFLIIIGAMIFGRFLAVSGLIDLFSEFVLALPVHPLVVLILILIIYMILGTFMEVVAVFALTLPIFSPLLTKLGFDPIWIGIIVLMMGEIGVITPPLGTNVYVVKAAAGEDVSLEQIFVGILPFFLAYLVSVALIILFPSIALWLPGMMKG